MRRLFPFLVLLGVIAAAWPARAETPSAACVAAIRAADRRHHAAGVPADCWRIGPLTLGMARYAAEAAAGRPDASASLATVYHHRRFALAEAVYVYPRNLGSWLRLVPQAASHFHPPTLRLYYWRDELVAMTAGRDARIDLPACRPTRPVRNFRRGGVDFPYDFHGIALGMPVAKAHAAFGRFASIDFKRHAANYWPVPLAFTGRAAIDSIAIATGMAFAEIDRPPVLAARRAQGSCAVEGYTVSAGR